MKLVIIGGGRASWEGGRVYQATPIIRQVAERARLERSKPRATGGQDLVGRSVSASVELFLISDGLEDVVALEDPPPPGLRRDRLSALRYLGNTPSTPLILLSGFASGRVFN